LLRHLGALCAFARDTFFPISFSSQKFRYLWLDFSPRLDSDLHRAVIQILRETTIAPDDFRRADGKPLRQLEDPARVAWNLTTATFYKAGGQPWRLGAPRKGVCYVGVVFKRDDTGPTSSHACVGAQMFLDSGDGVVFRGAVGPWYSEDTRTFNLPKDQARKLLSMVVSAYQTGHDGEAPTEVFVHGKTHFSETNGKASTRPCHKILKSSACESVKILDSNYSGWEIRMSRVDLPGR
jgi:hypothetical protein